MADAADLSSRGYRVSCRRLALRACAKPLLSRMQEAIQKLNTLQTPAKELAEQKKGGARDLTKAVDHVKVW